MNRFVVLAAGAVASLALGAAALAEGVQPDSPNAATSEGMGPAAPLEDGATPEAPPVEASAAENAASANNPVSKGRIVFFRPSRLPGAIYTYHIVEVADDGKPAKDAPHLGVLPNGGAFAVEIEGLAGGRSVGLCDTGERVVSRVRSGSVVRVFRAIAK